MSAAQLRVLIVKLCAFVPACWSVPGAWSAPAIHRGTDDSIHPVRRALRHFVVYGKTKRYRPLRKRKASGATARRPSAVVYLPLSTATRLTMMASVKTMDSQR